MRKQLLLPVPCRAPRSGHVPARRRRGRDRFRLLGALALCWAACVCGRPAVVEAAKPEGAASTSRAAREDAVGSIPLDELSDEGRRKVASVLKQVSIFRRLPTQVIDCDPQLYLFLVEHPDLVVNMWEVMGVSDMRLAKTGATTFKANDGVGTEGHVEYLYSDHDTHLLFAEGAYEGPLFVKPVHGRCLLLLKTGYVRETNGRYFVSCRLDAFIQLQNVGLELVARTFQPLVGKTADHNFRETAAFMGLVSRTAEVNQPGLVQLASKLTKVDAAERDQFLLLSGRLSEKSTLEPSAVRQAASTSAAPRRAAPKSR